MLKAHDLIADMVVDGRTLRVLDRLDFSIAPGEVVDIVGPSGSGKSTLLRALAWMDPFATGDLSLLGRACTNYGPTHWRSLVTLLPQKPRLVAPTVEGALLLPWTLSVYADRERPDRSSLRELLDAVGLEEIALDREVDRLSVGQQARVAFVRAIAAKPRVLLLDEADAALDSVSAAAVSSVTKLFVAQEDRAVVRVRHRETDGIANRRFRLASGAITEEAVR